jgi:hypothetical protein
MVSGCRLPCILSYATLFLFNQPILQYWRVTAVAPHTVGAGHIIHESSYPLNGTLKYFYLLVLYLNRASSTYRTLPYPSHLTATSYLQRHQKSMV